MSTRSDGSEPVEQDEDGCIKWPTKMRYEIAYVGGLRTKIEELEAEVARLKSGMLTPEEFQELCHNLHLQNKPVTFCEFVAGCSAVQRQLFGKSIEDELKESKVEETT